MILMRQQLGFLFILQWLNIMPHIQGVIINKETQTSSTKGRNMETTVLDI